MSNTVANVDTLVPSVPGGYSFHASQQLHPSVASQFPLKLQNCNPNLLLWHVPDFLPLLQKQNGRRIVYSPLYHHWVKLPMLKFETHLSAFFTNMSALCRFLSVLKLFVFGYLETRIFCATYMFMHRAVQMWRTTMGIRTSCNRRMRRLTPLCQGLLEHCIQMLSTSFKACCSHLSRQQVRAEVFLL